MIETHYRNSLWSHLDEVLIPVEKIAHVQDQHFLMHALLVLSNVRYATIPVLDAQGVFKGLISAAMIMNGVMGLSEIEFDKLDTERVATVMDTSTPTITRDADIEEVMRLLIDNNFLTVVDGRHHFVGLVTRREVLKKVNYLLHNLPQPE